MAKQLEISCKHNCTYW